MSVKSLSIIFLWTVRIFGFLPVADRKYSKIFSIGMTLIHVIPTSIMVIWPLYSSISKGINVPQSAEFWLYTGMVWQCCEYKIVFKGVCDLNKIFLTLTSVWPRILD